MRAALRVVCEIGGTAGVVLLMFCAYLLWGTGSYTERHQRVLRQQFEQEIHEKNGKRSLGRVRLGSALALLRIPRLGSDYTFAIVEGVDAEALREGPGHYPGTALPGQTGNFVVSGHRTTYLAPFNRIGELRRGDDIVVDTHEARYTYRVTRKEVVLPTRLDVIAPVPGHPSEPPSKALITMTTCNPMYSASERLIVHGVLADRERRT
ncbi:class E sortase [Microtetraspora sp. AC03309]|uniref:class E sortase n=1 Tax=Microtetraspora sp. AC03309 TaxID=2779376 RepID=UPI001E5D9084|nr:class E sortase [Microtetraspora sp. AC03309]MCC5577004.1 class E sortase [Microtetraspora sp. AC03309]